MLRFALDGTASRCPSVGECANVARWALRGLNAAGLAAAVAGLAVTGTAHAQRLQNVGSANTLQQLSGQNAAQSQMGVSIDDVCPTLATNKSSLDANGQDLADVCTRMVLNANDVRGLGGGSGGYGLGEDELNGALQQINGEENTQPRRQLSEVRDSQASAIGGRMAALREGARGANVAISGLDDLTARQFALGQGFTDTQQAQDDQFSNLVPDWGLFLIGNFGWGDRDTTSTAEGFDFLTYGGTGGVDYRFTDNFIAGLAGGFNFFDADFDTSINSASGQELNSWSGSISGYSTFYIGDSFYIEGVASYSYIDYDSERRIVITSMTPGVPSENHTATGDFTGHQYTVSGGVGYTASIEGFDLTPYARGSYLHADIGSYTESGAAGLNLSFGDQDVDSLTSTLGLQVSKAISTNFGILLPTISGEWIHEFLNNNGGGTVTYASDPTGLSTFTAATEDPDRDYFQVGAGLVAALPGGWSPFANFSTILGLENLTSHLFTVGLRKEL